MSATPEQKAEQLRQELSRRDFMKHGALAGAVAGGSMGAFYFGYQGAVADPVRVGVIGTGDEGSVLIGAINPDYIDVRTIADLRPFSQYRAFHGDHSSPAALKARCGLMAKYGWATEDAARKHVKVYTTFQELIRNAKRDGIEAVIIALPLFLHAPAAIMAMRAGLHVLTEKLMGHTVANCKEMARVAKTTNKLLATGHQRHYNVLYAEAVDKIQRGAIGDLHYIRAQWHRDNMPGKDAWQQPMPKEIQPEDPQAYKLLENLGKAKAALAVARGAEIDSCQRKIAQLEAQISDKILHEKAEGEDKTRAEAYGYQEVKLPQPDGSTYTMPAAGELIRWRLFDRTSAGLMAELGSHQLDAASIFISAIHGGKKQIPLSVVAAANRPVFPHDRDANDHVYCIFEFPAPGYYDDEQKVAEPKKKIGVQYSSINGNGFGGYGEIVFGTKGTLLLKREQEMDVMLKESASKVTTSAAAALDTQASGPAQRAVEAGPRDVSRGYTEEEEHWAWCIRNPDPNNQPRCHPKVALGDAVIALTTNLAARGTKENNYQPERIVFDPAWFDPDDDATPDGEAVNVDRDEYKLT